MNEKRTRRRQCAGTLGECEEKNAGRNHRRTRARVSRRVGGDTTSFCAPKTDSLLPLFPIRRESPKQRKRKNGIGILRVGTPSPQRSATTTASFSSSDDHSPRNRFRVSRSRSHRPPTSRWPQSDRCANVGNRRAESVRVAFVFRAAKKRTIFLFFLVFFFFFCCCCYFVAGLARVLCGAPNA